MLDREEEAKNKLKLICNKIAFTDDPESGEPKQYEYPVDSIQPYLSFTKLLALRPCDQNHKMKLQLNIPDTIIFNDKDCPLMWFYTDSKGFVCRTDNIPYTTIVAKFAQQALDKELVAVLKTSDFGYGGVCGNDVKPVSTGELKNALTTALGSRGEPCALQRFVRSGSAKASLVRTAYRKNGTPEAWILSSNYEYFSNAKVNEINKLIVNVKSISLFTANKCLSEKFLKETLESVKKIACFIESHLKICFLELVCDFIRDEGGNWWYVNTRAFKIEGNVKADPRLISLHEDERVARKKSETYTRSRKCRYCERLFSDHVLTHELTLLMLLQCDRHLIRLGKDFTWLHRVHSHHLDSVSLYVLHRVCDSCYAFYLEMQKLMRLQKRMAELTGIKVCEDDRKAISITAVPAFRGRPPQFGSRLLKTKYEEKMPLQWSLPTETEVEVGLQSEFKQLKKYRIMVYLHSLRDIPAEAISSTKQISIRYHILNCEFKYNLPLNSAELQEANLYLLAIEKIKIIYCFAPSRKELKEYLKNQSTLKITLFEDKVEFASADLELNDFQSELVIKRDYFKMFSGKKVFPYLSWGLFASVGLADSGEIPSSTLELSRFDGLLVPELDYYGCDLLAEEWIAMINEKNDKQKSKALSAYSANKNEIESLLLPQNEIYREIENYSKRDRKALSYV